MSMDARPAVDNETVEAVTASEEMAEAQQMRLRERLCEAVRSRPLLAVLAASGVGATLGGLVFSRLGRLVFLAAAGYAASELWRREGKLDTRELIARLSGVRQA
jgi:hypothetical protein